MRGRPAFESLLLPVLTSAQCSSPPSIEDTAGKFHGREAIQERQKARAVSESVHYNGWVNGVHTAAALLCDENGELVPWDSVADVIGSPPGWWKQKVAGVSNGALVLDNVLELSDEASQEEIHLLEGQEGDKEDILELSEEAGHKGDIQELSDEAGDKESDLSESQAEKNEEDQPRKKTWRERKGQYIALDKYHMVRCVFACLFCLCLLLEKPEKEALQCSLRSIARRRY